VAVALYAWRIDGWRISAQSRARRTSLARTAAFTPTRSQTVTVITSFAKAEMIRKIL
jgi:hypothetical protein